MVVPSSRSEHQVFFNPWQAIPDEDDKRGETRVGCNEGNPPAFQMLGNDRERPILQGEKGCGEVETVAEDDTADRGPPGSEPLAASGDSQEQWVCVSGGEDFSWTLPARRSGLYRRRETWIDSRTLLSTGSISTHSLIHSLKILKQKHTTTPIYIYI